MPLSYTYPSESLLLTPSPREISRRLLARNRLIRVAWTLADLGQSQQIGKEHVLGALGLRLREALR